MSTVQGWLKKQFAVALNYHLVNEALHVVELELKALLEVLSRGPGYLGRHVRQPVPVPSAPPGLACRGPIERRVDLWLGEVLPVDDVVLARRSRPGSPWSPAQHEPLRGLEGSYGGSGANCGATLARELHT